MPECFFLPIPASFTLLWIFMQSVLLTGVPLASMWVPRRKIKCVLLNYWHLYRILIRERNFYISCHSTRNIMQLPTYSLRQAAQAAKGLVVWLLPSLQSTLIFMYCWRYKYRTLLCSTQTFLFRQGLYVSLQGASFLFFSWSAHNPVKTGVRI